ncbi:hypothetical protein, partial [Paenibacillus sp. UASWS1643]|uniref:hypothetical protein n=1 Tax=Paenibacillus sp. UASWS1643 TaxID=2580422 RepID=UPI001685871F
WRHHVRSASLRSHQAAMHKGSTMIPLRSIIVPGICELNQGRKERTGMRRFFWIESIFFPFAFRMVTRAKAY